jgi:hypothetical protein
MRRFSLAVALALTAPLSLATATTASAQVSDSERAAARKLFSEGDQLQQAGKYEEALDKFKRAQAVFSAPTNLLRIAQCQAMLGKLVESAETYRTLIRTPLPAGSPPAFQQAVEQAKGELQGVEPRVPTVKIDVSPANVPNMQVQLNGQPLNAALIGEPLPLDPGTHKILVFAPGYASNEQSVTLVERDKKSMSFILKPSGGVVYGGTTGGNPNGPGDDGKTPGGGAGNSDGTPPPPPPPPDQWQTKRKPATSSILLGARLGVSIPTGDLWKDNLGNTYPVSDYASTGGAFALEGGLRFARSFYIGIFLEGGSYGKGNKAATGPVGTDTTTSQTSSAIGAVLAYISNPYGVGFYGEIGVDYRSISQKITVSGGGTSTDFTESLSGAELVLGAGVHILLARTFRLIPKVSVGLGAFSHPSCDASSGNCSIDESKFNTASHAFVFIGLGGYYNIDLH